MVEMSVFDDKSRKKILKNYLKAPVKEFDKDKLYNPFEVPEKLQTSKELF